MPCNTNQAVSFIRLNNPEQVKFIWFWLQSEFIRQLMWLKAVQSAQPNLAMGKLSNFPVIYPPISEQKAIFLHIEKETATLNQAIATIEKEIALVQEYRTTLIAEAVTGKIQIMGNEQWEMDNEAEEFDIEGEIGLDTEGGEEEGEI